MKLEDEKKIVAEWMGWKTKFVKKNKGYEAYQRSNSNVWQAYDYWNPQEDRNCWPEIFDRFKDDLEFRCDFMEGLRSIMGNDHWSTWTILTAKPELCWEVLIKCLEASK